MIAFVIVIVTRFGAGIDMVIVFGMLRMLRLLLRCSLLLMLFLLLVLSLVLLLVLFCYSCLY